MGKTDHIMSLYSLHNFVSTVRFLESFLRVRCRTHPPPLPEIHFFKQRMIFHKWLHLKGSLKLGVFMIKIFTYLFIFCNFAINLSGIRHRLLVENTTIYLYISNFFQ